MVLLAAKFAQLFTGDDGARSSATSNAEASTKSAHRLNEPVSAGTMEWRITGVRVGTTFSSDGNSVATDSDQSVLVLVTGTVTNRSNEEVTHIGNLYLVDGRGSRYGEKDGAELITDPLTLNSFNPNVPKKFTTIFEVPKNATGLQFEATDFGPLSADTALIDLGITSRPLNKDHMPTAH